MENTQRRETSEAVWYGEEIELRDILYYLWRARWWMLTGVLLLLALGLSIRFMRPVSYTVQAIISINIALDEDTTLEQWAQIFETREWLLTYLQVPVNNGLRFEVQNPDNTPFLYLEVTAPSPEEARTWATRWSEAVVAWIIDDTERRIEELYQAAQEAEATYREAQQTYLTFLQNDPRPALQLERQQLERQRNCAVSRLHYFQLLRQELQDIQTQLEQRPVDTFMLLTLQQRALASAPCGGDANLVLQTSPEDLVPLNADEIRERLKSLVRFVEDRIREEETALQDLDKRLRTLQRKLEEAERQALEYRTMRDKAWEDWRSLQDQWERAQLSMRLKPPARIEVYPLEPTPQQNLSLPLLGALALVGGSLGGALAYGLYSTMREIWEQERREQKGA